MLENLIFLNKNLREIKNKKNNDVKNIYKIYIEKKNYLICLKA